MRELKFRVWDEKYHCWDNSLIICYPNEVFKKQGRTIQLFTGLTDKNNNLIFEGDIVRGMFDFGPTGFIEITLPVSWHDTQGYQWTYWDLLTIEIVGNIFETPELLKNCK